MREHGNRTMYVNGGCRCDECRRANADYYHKLRDRNRDREPPYHGRDSTYSNWSCRCDACRAAHSARMAAYSARRKAARA